MSQHPDDQAKSFEWLSALADGEAHEREIAQACAAWKAQGEVRERWHAYQLIGDVMRSEGLASSKTPDADFLAQFRDRLAQEPVVLAPAAQVGALPQVAQPAAAAPLRRRAWAGPAAVAAGFVMVLGVALNTLQPGLTPAGQGGAQLASTSSSASPAAVPTLANAWVGQEGSLSPALRGSLVADGAVNPASHQSSFTGQASPGQPGALVVIRDAQLDEFLAAHHEASPAGVFAPPAALVRSVAFEAPTR